MMHENKAIKPGKIRNAGFTLVEVMIGISVFLVAMLGIAALTGSTWQQTGCAESFTEASVEAAQQLESMFSAKYASNQITGMDAGMVNGWHNTTVDRYAISYLISDEAVLPNTKSVQMNVGFTCNGRQQNIRYNYLVPMRQ